MFTLHKAYNLLEKKRLPLPCNQTLYVFDAVKHIHQLWEAQLVHSLPIEEIVVIATNIPALPATPVSAATALLGKVPQLLRVRSLRGEAHHCGPDWYGIGSQPVVATEALNTMQVDNTATALGSTIPILHANTTPSAGPSGHPETYNLPYGALTNMDKDSPLYKKYEQLSFGECTKQETVMSKTPYGFVTWVHRVTDCASAMRHEDQTVSFTDQVTLLHLTALADAASECEWHWLNVQKITKDVAHLCPGVIVSEVSILVL
ncbi:hypothetical protein BDQ17DRAFT_1440651 [Cyathus striatus]|nr:hypothetical protein BDQ17DRAFT_1440651 [Cyathus striatus]